MQIAMVNNGLFSAFDLTGRIVIVDKDLKTVRAKSDFSAGGEIAPNFPFSYQNDSVGVSRNSPLHYIVLAIRYYEDNPGTRNVHSQCFYMKWRGAKDGFTMPDFLLAEIPERDALKENLREVFKDFQGSKNQN